MNHAPPSIEPEADHAMQKLAREAVGVALCGGLVLLGAAALLGLFWSWSRALQWLIQAGLLWALVIIRLRHHLSLNRRHAGTALYSTLGWANQVTVLRGFLTAMTGGFLFQPSIPTMLLFMPAITYSVAAIVDRVDGFIARKTGQSSLLGETLDVELDALGLVVAPLLAVWIGQIHWSYLLVSVAYYLFRWGLARRRRLGLPVYELPRNMKRRAVAGFQMAFIAVILWPVLKPPATVVGGFAFMIVLLYGFIVDWLTVSGRIDYRSPSTASFFTRLNAVTSTLFLPILRLVIAVLLLTILQSANGPATGLPMLDSLLTGLVVLSGAMILLGVAGRIFTVTLVIFFSWFFLPVPFTLEAGVLLFAIIWVMQLGTGRYSLWLGDDHWVNRYDGEGL